MIGTVYGIVVGSILAFPWLVVGLMVAGALWDRRFLSVERRRSVRRP